MDNNSAVEALSALAFDTRLKAVQLLANIGEEGLPAGDIARQLDVPQNTLSDHLRALVRAGLLTCQRQSRSIVYRANPECVRDLLAFLSLTCAASSNPA